MKYKVIIRWPTLIAHEEQSSDEDNQTHFLVIPNRAAPVVETTRSPD